MSEIAIFETSNIKVTETKVIINGTTYFLSNITSVKIEKLDTILTFGIIIGILSLLCIIISIIHFNITSLILGIIGTGVGIIMYKFGISWELILTTGAAEKHALQSPNKDLVLKVISAINLAVEK